jgi:hypothetical protein
MRQYRGSERLTGINANLGKIGPGSIKVFQMMATDLSLNNGPNPVAFTR